MLDFNPISSITIPGIEKISHKGLTVIVGPNSSGKTQLLHDIEHVIQGKRRQLIVAEDIEYKKPENYETFIQTLEFEGYLKRTFNSNGQKIINKISPNFGRGGGVGDISENDATTSFNNFLNYLPQKKSYSDVPFLSQFGLLLSTILFLSNRLTLVNQQHSFDYENSPPSNDFQALYLNDPAQENLTEEIMNTFGKGIWLDATKGNILCLRVSESKTMPSDADRRSPTKMAQYRTIENEGDGFKSYVGICISLLLGRRPICLIDEPELCLHPPQAYVLGKFIGKFCNDSSHMTLVATHSSHLLRGIIEKSDNACILRMTRNNGEFKGSLVEPSILKDSTKRPLIKAETILDGIFSDAIILVEAESDRIVYEAAWEKISDSFLFDIRFISVGGTGGFLEVLKFYNILHIPVSIISDLDIILDKDKLKNILDRLKAEGESKEKILEKCQLIREKLNQILPKISENEFKTELKSLVEMDIRWENVDDFKISKKLTDIAEDIQRNGNLKRGGIANFSNNNDIFQLINEVIELLHSVGLFCVPVGELEYWVADLMKDGPSRKRKAEWAHEAARRIRESDSKTDDIWDFLKNIGQHLKLKIDGSDECHKE